MWAGHRAIPMYAPSLGVDRDDRFAFTLVVSAVLAVPYTGANDIRIGVLDDVIPSPVIKHEPWFCLVNKSHLVVHPFSESQYCLYGWRVVPGHITIGPASEQTAARFAHISLALPVSDLVAANADLPTLSAR